jgi:hypothetical protein
MKKWGISDKIKCLGRAQLESPVPPSYAQRGDIFIPQGTVGQALRPRHRGSIPGNDGCGPCRACSGRAAFAKHRHLAFYPLLLALCQVTTRIGECQRSTPVRRFGDTQLCLITPPNAPLSGQPTDLLGKSLKRYKQILVLQRHLAREGYCGPSSRHEIQIEE